MSEVKVNNFSPRTNCGTVQLGDSGDTITIPAGATITNNGTQTGFGRTGTVNWQTTLKTSNFSAVAGQGFFVDTNGGAVTATLPSSPTALDIIAFKDYRLTFDTNNLTIDPGSNKIEGDTTDMVVDTEGRSLTLVYLDSTQGWKVVNDGNSTAGTQASFVTATGGTVKTSGNFKTHIFTGPGTFCVSNGGNSFGSNTAEYFVLAGGGSGGGYNSTNEGLGGGGAGGFRLSAAACVPAPTMSPLAKSCGALPVTVQGYPITVGGGGARTDVCTTNPAPGNPGSNSIFSTITSAGGGGGAPNPPAGGNGFAGGSGGGGNRGNSTTGVGGAGNTPSVSPPQGQTGGGGTPLPSQGPPAPVPTRNGGGGGGAGAVGAEGVTANAGTGGAGSFIADAFIGGCAPSFGTPGPVSSTRYFAGGGGGSGGSGGQPGGGAGAGNGRQGTNGDSASDNSGSGGGGGNNTLTPGGAGLGGSGIVMIRYKFQQLNGN